MWLEQVANVAMDYIAGVRMGKEKLTKEHLFARVQLWPVAEFQARWRRAERQGYPCVDVSQGIGGRWDFARATRSSL